MLRPMFLVAVLLACLLSTTQGFDLVEGSSYQARRVASQKFEYAAYPLLVRTKDYFFNEPGNNVIKAIQAIDLDHSQATVRVTAGGIGQSYVNLRFESERSSGLNYQIDIYV